jgi:hypothetical protein
VYRADNSAADALANEAMDQRRSIRRADGLSTGSRQSLEVAPETASCAKLAPASVEITKSLTPLAFSTTALPCVAFPCASFGATASDNLVSSAGSVSNSRRRRATLQSGGAVIDLTDDSTCDTGVVTTRTTHTPAVSVAAAVPIASAAATVLSPAKIASQVPPSSVSASSKPGAASNVTPISGSKRPRS